MTSLRSQLVEKYERDGLSTTVWAGLRFLRARLRRSTRYALYSTKSLLGNDKVLLNGVKLDLSSPVVTAPIRRRVWRGDYEADEARFVQTYLSPDTDVVELGSGLGYVSATIATVLNADRTQVAVEPNPDVVTVLQRTRELNACSFAIEQRAYSMRESVGLGPEAAFWSAATESTDRGQISVEGTSLRGLLERYDISDFTLVADIEGGEFELFESELDVLSERCELVVVEFHPDETEDIESYRQMLDRAGFERVDSRNDVAVYRNVRG